MSNARTQAYNFAHQVLPHLFFANPEQFLHYFEENPTDFLRFHWDNSGKTLSPDLLVEVTNLRGEIINLQQEQKLVFITLPPPQELTEAYFIAIIHKPHSGPPQEGSDYYFTLEHSLSFDGGERTVVGEWLADGSHQNHGSGPPPDREAFINKVMALLSS